MLSPQGFEGDLLKNELLLAHGHMQYSKRETTLALNWILSKLIMHTPASGKKTSQLGVLRRQMAMMINRGSWEIMQSKYCPIG